MVPRDRRERMETAARGRSAAAGTFLALAGLAAIRLSSLAPDPWEWDEVLLVNAVERGLDIRINQPHPPGYPLFVEAGWFLRSAGVSPFAAALIVGTAGGLVSVLGVVFLGTRLGLSPPFALLGALFYAFIPAVWLHGVRPLTDPAATAAFLFAAGVLVEVIRTARASQLLLAAFLTALTFGLRPQAGFALLPLALVAAVRTARRPLGGRAVLIAAAAGILLTVAIWLPAVEGSGGLTAFRERLAEQGRYIHEVDRARASDLVRSLFWKRWFRDPFADSGLAYTLLVLAAGALFVRARQALHVLGVLLPVTIFSVLVLGAHSAPRYASTVLAAPCLLAALSLERLSETHRLAAAAAGAGLVAWLAWTAVPPILEVHRRPSPSVAAMTALREDPALRGRPLFYDGHLEVHLPRYLPGRAAVLIPDAGLPPTPAGSLVVATNGNTFGLANPIRTFRFEDRSLGRISRGRYLTVRIYEAGGEAGGPVTSSR